LLANINDEVGDLNRDMIELLHLGTYLGTCTVKRLSMPELLKTPRFAQGPKEAFVMPQQKY
jgi:hypothetical protein